MFTHKVFVFTHKARVHKLGARVLRRARAPHNNDKSWWFPQSGAVGLFTRGRLIAFGLNLSPVLSDSAQLSGIQRPWRRAGRLLWHPPQQGVRCAFTVPVCLRTHACVQEGIGVFGVLSEIDGVEQLLFYLIYL